MSRDRGDATDPRELALLTAYVDKVAELAPDERKRIEARLADDPQARAGEPEVHALVRPLRELPPESNERDWSTMEHSIRAAVGSEVPRPWWRAWRWLVPLTSCATAAAVMLLLWSRPALREPGRGAIPAAPVVPRPATPAVERV